MKKIMLFAFVSVLSVTLGCGQEQSYLEGIIEKVDENDIIMLVEENESKVGETDKVWLTRGQSVDFGALENGQRIKVWVSDEYVRLSSPPQVTATKIEVIS